MNALRSLAILCVFLVSLLCAARDIRVAADSSGDFKTVQAAIDSVPDNNSERVVVSIANGTYSEQLRIHKPFITLRGEDRQHSRITSYVDTSACAIQPGESVEEHCATVLANGTDIVVENLTVENSYKGNGKGAALTFMGDSTRIVLSNVDVIGFGGDTLGLTARRDRIGGGGEYYLDHVYVSGRWHIIVPRGNTYVAKSKFACLGENLYCLFAEGITRERDKLAIVHSTIEGPQPFRLGSYFRDAAWYFVDDRFGNNLSADGQIQREPARNYQMKWGEGRVYFADARGPEYAWLKDNIAKSPAKTAANVTASWVLPEWNPESAVAPTVWSIAVQDGVRVTFSESVTVRSVPQLKLAGCATQYVRGSGSDTLVFSVVSGKRCGTQVEAIELNGGAIFASAASLKDRHADLKLPRP